MSRVAAAVLVFAIGMAPSQPVVAGPPQDRGAEIAAVALEEILGAAPDDIVVVRTEHTTSYEVRLSPEEMANFRQLAAKNQVLLTAGKALSKPSSATTLITGATLACVFDYYFWWAYVNYSSTAFDADMTHQLKGPGKKFKNRFNQSLSAGTVAVVVTNGTHEIGREKPGLYTHMVKAGGLGSSGKIKLRYVGTGTGC